MLLGHGYTYSYFKKWGKFNSRFLCKTCQYRIAPRRRMHEQNGRAGVEIKINSRTPATQRQKKIAFWSSLSLGGSNPRLPRRSSLNFSARSSFYDHRLFISSAFTWFFRPFSFVVGFPSSICRCRTLLTGDSKQSNPFQMLHGLPTLCLISNNSAFHWLKS